MDAEIGSTSALGEFDRVPIGIVRSHSPLPGFIVRWLMERNSGNNELLVEPVEIGCRELDMDPTPLLGARFGYSLFYRLFYREQPKGHRASAQKRKRWERLVDDFQTEFLDVKRQGTSDVIYGQRQSFESKPFNHGHGHGYGKIVPAALSSLRTFSSSPAECAEPP